MWFKVGYTGCVGFEALAFALGIAKSNTVPVLLSLPANLRVVALNIFNAVLVQALVVAFPKPRKFEACDFGAGQFLAAAK